MPRASPDPVFQVGDYIRRTARSLALEQGAVYRVSQLSAWGNPYLEGFEDYGSWSRDNFVLAEGPEKKPRYQEREYCYA